jgi:uncharacterized membrane-anchored protein YhcB (DUF1043 family)
VEYLDSVWQIGIIALVAGVMIGALAYRLLAPSIKQADQIKSELDTARDELDSYKASVGQHFNKTSELVNDLTQNYVKVYHYQHLAEGAQTLGDSKTFNNLLEQQPGRVSIAVDDSADTADTAADDLVAEPLAAQAAAVETVDEHAEPFTDVKTAGVDPDGSENDTAESEASASTGNQAEASEPVINVDALDKVAESAKAETRAKTDSALAAGEEKTEVRTTSH